MDVADKGSFINDVTQREGRGSKAKCDTKA